MMLLNSVHGFEKCLKGDSVVFGVECALTPTCSLTLSPPARSLSCTLAGALGHTVRTAMIFRHWMELDDGTAVLNPAPTADDDTLAACTFYSQVSTDPRLHDAVDSIQSTFASVIQELDKELQSWYSYEHVWRRDKSSTVTKFCARGPSVKQYDDKLRFYTHLASELSQAPQQVTHGCVSLDVRKLVGQVVGHTSEWVKLLGTGLMKEARSRLQHVLHKVTTVNKDLQTAPEDLVALTVVMRAVGRVSQDHAHLHTALLDVRQMFHTLQVYGIVVPREDHEQLEETSARLDVLHHTATSVQKNIEPVQKFFLANTQKKVADFSAVVQKFCERFESQGPGAVGEDLDKGVALLKEYTEEVSQLLDQRRVLDEEEDVFDLAATQYPGLDSAIHVMDQMRDVFNVYKQLRAIETTWRTMRWATAKLDELKTQVEEVREALLACSGAQETEVGRSLLQRLSDHTTSLEVTAALRQPAVQPRHWQHLVTVAGCAGGWASASGLGGVSVWDVLELRLSRHPLLVASTVAAAVRESLLSSQMREITRFWQRARLCVLTTSSVWRVEGLEDQLATLQHHNLALKTLRATKYCKPFEEEARRLAKTLVAVGDLLEVWQAAQADISLLLSAAVSSLIEGSSNLRVKHRQLLERTERRSFVLELAANPSYVEEVSALHGLARRLIADLADALARPRRQCPRLYFLTDLEVMALMAQPSPDALDGVIAKLFNHVVAVKHADDAVTGLVSAEGEQLNFPEAVALVEDVKSGEEAGVNVGVGVQQVLEASHEAMKSAVHKAIEELGKETKMQRAMLQETPTAATTVAWRVWWAASVDLALHARAKGDRQAVRQTLSVITDDIAVVLAAMGRGHGASQEQDAPKDEQEEEAMPLSSARTPASVCSQGTSRKGSLPPLPPPRILPLLMATLHARDVVATLVRNNTSTSRSFTWSAQPRYTWQPQHALLQLRAAHRALDYGYEYSGCGPADYVLTPPTERCLLALFTAVAAHSPPLMLGGVDGGCGRHSLVSTASHLAGRLITSFTLSPLTSSASLTALLTGSVVGGSWLVLRACTEASPSLLATLASTLLLMHRARTHDTATPVIPIAGQEAAVHPGVAVILCGNEASVRARGKTPALPHSLDTLCRPVRVSAPPPRTLVFAWLLAHDVPKAQEASEAVAEVTRQVLESYPGLARPGLRLYQRVTKEVVCSMAALADAVSPLEAAIAAFRQVMLPRLPHRLSAERRQRPRPTEPRPHRHSLVAVQRRRGFPGTDAGGEDPAGDGPEDLLPAGRGRGGRGEGRARVGLRGGARSPSLGQDDRHRRRRQAPAARPRPQALRGPTAGPSLGTEGEAAFGKQQGRRLSLGRRRRA
ncbi:dynein heavy chain 10, axonemal-like [Penaeus monodon]|uniref:dynein heavy chain 10, axonemal-like n=1 Tax=Penaeus monodon TaxID=6687 RepID=UPI0018A75DE2|nr:dynein heavy chain 10, axonemal-like [Penaeus monodon]